MKKRKKSANFIETVNKPVLLIWGIGVVVLMIVLLARQPTVKISPGNSLDTATASLPSQTPDASEDTNVIASPRSVAKSSPIVTSNPSPDAALIAACKTAWLPLAEFSGHDCLYTDPQMQWVKSRNGKPLSESELDSTIVGLNESGVKPRLLDQCYNVDKTRYEQCSTSIRDNGNRLRQELLTKYAANVASCTNQIPVGDQTSIDSSRRFFAKNRMNQSLENLYDYCYSHGGSVQDFHF